MQIQLPQQVKYGEFATIRNIMSETIEQKVSETILQKMQEVTIGGATYQVAPPTTSTLILASEHISKLPSIKLDGDKILVETLYIAKDCRVLGDIVAILILGAKGLTEIVKVPEIVEKTIEKIVYEEYLYGLIKRPKIITETISETVEKEVTIDRKAELAKKLLDEIPPLELNDLMAVLLRKMQISDFFGFTTSLIEINLLRQTREVGTTAFGL